MYFEVLTCFDLSLTGAPPPNPKVTLWPKEKFLVRTVVLSNMTTIHRGIENFKADMESRRSSCSCQMNALQLLS